MNWFKTPSTFIRNELINIVSKTTLSQCITTHLKQWTLYRVNEMAGLDEQKIILKNNPTLNYAELILQPKTLEYGLYRIVITIVTKLNESSFSISNDTFIQITPSGLVLSTLKQSQPMFGSAIEISRGLNQTIEFDPFLFTYDIDMLAVITSLTFKYTCQKVVSNIPQGFPKIPATKDIVHLNEIKMNSSLMIIEKCFSSIGKLKSSFFFQLPKPFLSNHLFKDDFQFDPTYNLFKIKGGSWLPYTQYEILVTTNYLNQEYSQKVKINIVSNDQLPLVQIE